MNQAIVGQKQGAKYLQKDNSFNILNLVNQMYKSKSTLSKGLK